MGNPKRDWEVVTGWEKRIKVDFGSIGPNHVRWSDWTHKERDIVARKVHESRLISDTFGPRSAPMNQWAEENAPIMVDFARDHKPMPDWAHADFRESGVPEYVQVVWKREDPNDLTSKADWAYDPPGPWEDKGAEPAWSARPMEPDYDPNSDYKGNMHSKFGGVISYKVRPNGDHVATDGTIVSTKESRAKADVPQWRKFELGRLEEVDGVIVPGPNALPKDTEQYGENVKLTGRHKLPNAPPAPLSARLAGLKRTKEDRIRPDDPKFTAAEKATSWALETWHGPDHQNRWERVAAALGVVNGWEPMGREEAEELYIRFNKNKRWTMVLNEMDTADMAAELEAEADTPPVDESMTKEENDLLASTNRYRKAVGLPPVKKSQNEKLREALLRVNERPDVVVKEYDPVTRRLREIRMTPAESHARDMDLYDNAPAMQGHFTVEEWKRMHGSDPTIALIQTTKEDGGVTIWGRSIIDPGLRYPNYWLEGEGAHAEVWEYQNGELGFDIAEPVPAAEAKVQAITGDQQRFVPMDIMEKLPTVTEKQADEIYKKFEGRSLSWVQQAEPREGPIVERVMFVDNEPIARKENRLYQFEHLPRMTPDEAQYHFTKVLKLSRYNRTTIDGHWGTVRGWRHPSTHANIAIEEYPDMRKMIGVPLDMAAAIQEGDWARVAELAEGMAG